MPWTVADVDKHKKGLTPAQKERWVQIANGVRRSCLAGGKPESACDAMAIRMANAGVNSNAVINFDTPQVVTFARSRTGSYQVREVIHQGRKHIIVPVTMMREGVHFGSHGPLYHTAEELGHFIGAWNGIPVVIYHPRENGENVSANTPEVIDREKVGVVYNARMNGDRLVGEAWIDVERITQVHPVAFQMLQQEEPMEVSLGLFSDDENSHGNWNDEEYIGIARNYRPDHLALLPDGQGACSWEDGCGVRSNESFEPPNSGDAPAEVKSILRRVYNQCRNDWVQEHPNDRENADNKTSCARIAWNAVHQAGWNKNNQGTWVKTHEEGGDPSMVEDNREMTTRSINDLPDSSFAYIEPGGHQDSGGKTVPRSLRHFPIHDAAHVRNALARLSQSPFGAKARKKVLAAAKKFGIEVSNHEEGGDSNLNENNEPESIQSTQGGSTAENENPSVNEPTNENEKVLKITDNLDETQKLLAKEGYFITCGEQGFRQIMETIQQKLDRMDDDMKVHFLRDTFSDFFIYEVRVRSGSSNDGAGLFKRGYTIDDNGTVEFTGESVAVHKETQYIENNSTKGGITSMAEETKKPCCPEKVNSLIQNEHTPYREEDREFLEALEEVQINKLTDLADSAVKEPKEDKTPAPVTNEQIAEIVRDQFKTPEQVIKLFSEDMQDVFNSGLRMHNKKRAELVEIIKSNSQFSEEELKGKKMDEIEKLAEMARPRDYSGLGGGSSDGESDGQEPLLPLYVQAEEGGQ